MPPPRPTPDCLTPPNGALYRGLSSKWNTGAHEVVERTAAPAGPGDPAFCEAFDKSLDGRISRLVDYSMRAPDVIADAVRHVLGRIDLGDDEAPAILIGQWATRSQDVFDKLPGKFRKAAA